MEWWVLESILLMERLAIEVILSVVWLALGMTPSDSWHLG